MSRRDSIAAHPGPPPEGASDMSAELHGAAEVLKAMAHPLRLVIICKLLRRPATLTEMSPALGVPNSTLAQHLRVLRHAGIIRGTRQGREVRFAVTDRRAQAIMSMLCSHLGSAAAPWDAVVASCEAADLQIPD